MIDRLRIALTLLASSLLDLGLTATLGSRFLRHCGLVLDKRCQVSCQVIERLIQSSVKDQGSVMRSVS